jgi:hypothetical protein
MTIEGSKPLAASTWPLGLQTTLVCPTRQSTAWWTWPWTHADTLKLPMASTHSLRRSVQATLLKIVNLRIKIQPAWPYKGLLRMDFVEKLGTGPKQRRETRGLEKVPLSGRRERAEHAAPIGDERR